MLNQAEVDEKFGFHPKCERVQLIHLSFADDILVFTDGTEESLNGVLTMMDQFASMLGLQINATKSTIFAAGPNSLLLNHAASAKCIQVDQLPIRYLGMPLTSKIWSKTDYEPLIDQLRKKFLSWTHGDLSFAGRLRLIKTAVTSTVNFWSSAFLSPKGCLDTIESMCSAFLWSGSPTVTHKAKVAWKDVCSSKEEGGLGSLGSWAWRKLLKLRPLAYDCLRYEVNNGRSIYFWLDNWLGTGRLLDETGETGIGCLGVLRSATISDVVCESGWKIHTRGQRRFPKVYAKLNARQLPNQHSGEDIVLWRAGPDDFKASFSSAKTWNYLRDKRTEVVWRKLAWFPQDVPRHAFMVWLAFRDRLTIGDRMKSWGIEQCCMLCGEKNETRDHLFFACPYSFTRMMFQTVIYYVWKERNSQRHGGVWVTTKKLTRTIDKQIRNRISSLCYIKDHPLEGLMSRWFEVF
ncbi:PREDICTED: uncharacterized protein LOC106329983 [Brassica oleracea var. oleracea]|uniref:uncharacterized protein LOC106329983 n=1 Tax=Brassica oleracea var. oleracea TaxID=109376 RepID=UPI0006A7011F|nr:PREDICTED: uncharacterized protein LOC106329983 [Brassica oleracea var. oleracea]